MLEFRIEKGEFRIEIANLELQQTKAAAEIDLDLIEAYRGIASLPFEAGDNKKIAVKIIDDRGRERLEFRIEKLELMN